MLLFFSALAAEPAPPPSAVAPDAWIPASLRSWKHEETVTHDFDGDGHPDVAITLTGPQGDNSESPPDRYLVVGLGTGSGHRLVLQSSCLAFCQTCGGLFGDPYAGIRQIGKASLQVSNYGGSAWRWSTSYTLAWRAGRMAVVGYDYTSFHASDPENVDARSINLLNGRAIENGAEKRHQARPLAGDDCAAIQELGRTTLR